MLPGQILPGQMSSWQLKSAKEVPRNLPLKFGQNLAINSWDIADIKFAEVGGVQSHFCVKRKPGLG